MVDTTVIAKTNKVFEEIQNKAVNPTYVVSVVRISKKFSLEYQYRVACFDWYGDANKWADSWNDEYYDCYKHGTVDVYTVYVNGECYRSCEPTKR